MLKLQIEMTYLPQKEREMGWRPRKRQREETRPKGREAKKWPLLLIMRYCHTRKIHQKAILPTSKQKSSSLSWSPKTIIKKYPLSTVLISKFLTLQNRLSHQETSPASLEINISQKGSDPQKVSSQSQKMAHSIVFASQPLGLEFETLSPSWKSKHGGVYYNLRAGEVGMGGSLGLLISKDRWINELWINEWINESVRDLVSKI